MTLTDRLNDAHQRSVALYLQRQQVESQRQSLAQQAQAIEVELLKLDGTIRLLDALITEPDGGE